ERPDRPDGADQRFRRATARRHRRTSGTRSIPFLASACPARCSSCVETPYGRTDIRDLLFGKRWKDRKRDAVLIAIDRVGEMGIVQILRSATVFAKMRKTGLPVQRVEERPRLNPVLLEIGHQAVRLGAYQDGTTGNI